MSKLQAAAARFRHSCGPKQTLHGHPCGVPRAPLPSADRGCVADQPQRLRSRQRGRNGLSTNVCDRRGSAPTTRGLFGSPLVTGAFTLLPSMSHGPGNPLEGREISRGWKCASLRLEVNHDELPSTDVALGRRGMHDCSERPQPETKLHETWDNETANRLFVEWRLVMKS